MNPIGFFPDLFFKEGVNMEKQSRWEKCKMPCPEGKGEGCLFVHWQVEGDKEVLASIHCDNVYLKDLSGGDCQWACWDKISKKALT
jgi:hypothetical protein